jgi:hypothetical protein
MKNYLFMFVVLLFTANSLTVTADESSSQTAFDQKNSKISNTDAEFAGSYQVGNTQCTVKPIKMAFEVRWLKGKGAMTFFFDKITPEGKSIFIGELPSEKKDQFIFNDNSYNTGVFIRADGRKFPVERLVKIH